MPSRDLSKYTPKAWEDRDFDFELPSGDICLLRRMEPLDLIEFGLQDKLDFATTVVMNTHVKNGSMSKVDKIKRDRAMREASAKGEDPDAAVEALEAEKALEAMKANPDQMRNMKEALNIILANFVVAPEMHEPPELDEDRVVGRYYTDAVPWNDKMAIFNKLMAGVKVVESFREGSEEAVGDVAPEPSVRPAAKSRARSPRKGSPR